MEEEAARALEEFRRQQELQRKYQEVGGALQAALTQGAGDRGRDLRVGFSRAEDWQLL